MKPARGLALPGLAIAALLALSTALPASASAARPAATCDSGPVFFGLHGMGEGPDSADQTQKHGSWEMLSFDYAQNQISGAVLFAPVTYPRVEPGVFWPDVRKGVKTTLADLDAGVAALQSAITTYAAGCKDRQDHIALVGYSMGAWVINDWLVRHPSEWGMVRAVVLFGDPCYFNSDGKGLVRRSPKSLGARDTCTPESTYPYPAAKVPSSFKAYSFTTSKDPVSGEGWEFDPAGQWANAITCTNPATCTHLDYVTKQAPDAPGFWIRGGAQIVVNRTT